MKRCFVVISSICLILFLSCENGNTGLKKNKIAISDTVTLNKQINGLLDEWHLQASKADSSFFDKMDSGSIYIGTDKTEHWLKEEFQVWAMPYFRKGKAWSFKATQRNIYYSDDKKMAWFDELLDTWMGVCRASGVLTNKNGAWKLKHYHLSVTCPNEVTKDFIELVKKHEEKVKGE